MPPDATVENTERGEGIHAMRKQAITFRLRVVPKEWNEVVAAVLLNTLEDIRGVHYAQWKEAA